MVRDVFRLAKENAPAIIFIDEVRPSCSFLPNTQCIHCVWMEAITGLDVGCRPAVAMLLSAHSAMNVDARVSHPVVHTFCALITPCRWMPLRRRALMLRPARTARCSAS